MPLAIKSGGVWRTIADGNLRQKSGGAWIAPAQIRIKANGVWNDPGYRGYPNPPSAPWVHAWNYTHTHIAFSGPSSGPPVQDYHVERLDANGTPVEGYYQTTGDRVFGTPQDTRHQFRVRSRGVNGLHSAWSSNLKVGIGHPETYTYGYVERTRAWSTGGSIGHGSVNNLHGFAVPGRVLVSQINWQFYLWGRQPEMYGPLSVYPPAYVEGGNRYIDIMLNNSYLWYRPNWPNSINLNDWPSYWGDGGITGFIPRETQTLAWVYLEVHGYMYIYGTQYYDNYEITQTHPAQANYYW